MPEPPPPPSPPSSLPMPSVRSRIPDQPVNRLDPGLYIVSTPIGNLRDITLRALDVLAASDAILCEDTRTSGVLLAHYGITTQRIACHAHNEAERIPLILDRITRGGALALISDAGTPLLSDPGSRVVRACLDAGLRVVPVPGANAVLPALQLSGLRGDVFAFGGFLPLRGGARKTALERWRGFQGSVLFYESPRRLVATLHDALDMLGDCPAAILREITKKFEETQRGPLSRLIAFYDGSPPPRGEIVLALEPLTGLCAMSDDVSPDTLDDHLRRALAQQGSVRKAVDQVAAMTRQPRRVVYNRALHVRGIGADNP